MSNESAQQPLLDYPYTSQRMPLLAQNVVCTSQPLAASAGIRMLAKGGNAVDAAIATAVALTVVEPCMNGIGGDAFVQVWRDGVLYGLNASGRAPSKWTPDYFSGHTGVPARGWGAVTVPGAVSGWRELSDRFGSLPFESLFAPAIEYATEGFLVSPTVHRQWHAQMLPEMLEQPGFREAFAPNARAPAPGDLFVCPGQAESLKRIASSGGEDFYSGELASKIVAHAHSCGGALSAKDLADHHADWVEPVAIQYRDVRLHEIGPNGQGISALMALGMLQNFDVPSMGRDTADSVHVQVEAMKLAFADLHRWVADPEFMVDVTSKHLLDSDYLKSRARMIDVHRAGNPGPGNPHTGGTVYLTTADRHGTMVSMIQSNYRGFGSGVVVPGTGIAMHNRGAGFTLEKGHPNQVGPRKRPLHTIIPAFITRRGNPLMSFGVMGASMQAQGHVQVTSRIADFGQNPQACSDAPRWRLMDDNRSIAVEWNMPPDVVESLRNRGHEVRVAPRFDTEFGSAQLAMRIEHGYVAASDHRKDGYPMGF